jgi:hypothetical protein
VVWIWGLSCNFFLYWPWSFYSFCFLDSPCGPTWSFLFHTICRLFGLLWLHNKNHYFFYHVDSSALCSEDIDPTSFCLDGISVRVILWIWKNYMDYPTNYIKLLTECSMRILLFLWDWDWNWKHENKRSWSSCTFFRQVLKGLDKKWPNSPSPSNIHKQKTLNLKEFFDREFIGWKSTLITSLFFPMAGTAISPGKVGRDTKKIIYRDLHKMESVAFRTPLEDIGMEHSKSSSDSLKWKWCVHSWGL